MADLIAGDTGAKLVVTCTDNETGNEIDLTSKAVQLRYKIDGGTLQTKTMTPDPDQVTNIGQASYQFEASDLTAGTMVAEVRVQPGGADQLTSVHQIALTVGAPLA